MGKMQHHVLQSWRVFIRKSRQMESSTRCGWKRGGQNVVCSLVTGDDCMKGWEELYPSDEWFHYGSACTEVYSDEVLKPVTVTMQTTASDFLLEPGEHGCFCQTDLPASPGWW